MYVYISFNHALGSLLFHNYGFMTLFSMPHMHVQMPSNM